MSKIIAGIVVVLALIALAWYTGLFSGFGERPIDYGDEVSYVGEASSDVIVVDSPQVGDVLGKTFTVSGKARGSWFSEGSFPVEILVEDGRAVSATIANAQGEWMTEDFVPFAVSVNAGDFTGPAVLALKKANPSGLFENDAAVVIPIVIAQ